MGSFAEAILDTTIPSEVSVKSLCFSVQAGSLRNDLSSLQGQLKEKAQHHWGGPMGKKTWKWVLTIIRSYNYVDDLTSHIARFISAGWFGTFFSRNIRKNHPN